jgi:hypothetical protein
MMAKIDVIQLGKASSEEELMDKDKTMTTTTLPVVSEANMITDETIYPDVIPLNRESVLIICKKAVTVLLMHAGFEGNTFYHEIYKI